MKGFHVARSGRLGLYGLPVEIAVEKNWSVGQAAH